MLSALLITALLAVSNLFGESIIKEELLPATTPFVHASTILETASEKLLVAWFGGEGEGASEDAIYLSQSTTNSDSLESIWSDPKIVATGHEVGVDLACWDPVLFQMPSGEILLFYKIGQYPSNWHGYLKRSIDDGETWSPPEGPP